MTSREAQANDLVKMSKESSTATMFSEQNCGSCTRHFIQAIERRDDIILSNIVVGATALIPSTLDALWEEEKSQDEEDIGKLIAALCKLFGYLCALLTSG